MTIDYLQYNKKEAAFQKGKSISCIRELFRNALKKTFVS